MNLAARSINPLLHPSCQKSYQHLVRVYKSFTGTKGFCLELVIFHYLEIVPLNRSDSRLFDQN